MYMVWYSFDTPRIITNINMIGFGTILDFYLDLLYEKVSITALDDRSSCKSEYNICGSTASTSSFRYFLSKTFKK